MSLFCFSEMAKLMKERDEAELLSTEQKSKQERASEDAPGGGRVQDASLNSLSPASLRILDKAMGKPGLRAPSHELSAASKKSVELSKGSKKTLELARRGVLDEKKLKSEKKDTLSFSFEQGLSTAVAAVKLEFERAAKKMEQDAKIEAEKQKSLGMEKSSETSEVKKAEGPSPKRRILGRARPGG